MGLEQKNRQTQINVSKYNNYVYVVISTLNQVINMIPYKIYNFEEVYNLTIIDSPYFSNSDFDKNLNINIKKTIEFSQNEMNNINAITIKLSEIFSDKDKIFWNITGGQRPFILAISEFIKNRGNDVLCYLEGNSSTMTIVPKNIKMTENIRYNESYITIEEALKLMGFRFKKIDTKKGNLDERKFYNDFYKLYKNENNKTLRKELIELNKTQQPSCKEFIEKSSFRKELENIDFCKNTEDDFKKQYPFGYILEKLAFYKLEQEIKSKVESLVHSLKIIFDDEDKQKEADHKIIDEFDIALLTKHGKFIIFECKSGAMSGDVAKSTKYSTYAISGVYGKPILITPLTRKEINDIDNLNESYKRIKSAIKSANRATLDVWGIDEIAEKISKYLD